MTAAAPVVSRLRDSIPGLLEEHGIPGMAVGICDRSGIVWSEAFGVTSKDGAEAVTTRTMFSIQSGSKLYTATAVMLAVQAGLLDLDAPVPTYLPGFTVQSRWETHPERRMTLRHLLSHRAGFAHEAPLGGNLDERDGSFDEHCRSISETWLRFPVGHHFEYSNLGIDLAALIVQEASGIPFPEYVRRELFEPLGLDRTTFDIDAIAAEPDRAIGHSALVDEFPVRVPMVGAGGVYTSVDDALRYLRVHLAGGLGVLRPELLERMYEVPDALPGQLYGYGLGVDRHLGDHRFLNHGGGGFGFLSDLAWDPAAGIGIVVLTNSMDHPLQARLAADVLSELTGSRRPEVALPPAVDPGRSALEGTVGEYVGRGGTTATVRLEDARLSLAYGGRERPLRPIGANQVACEDGAHERFAFAGAYLIRVEDGFTYYRNDAPRMDGAAVRSYAVDYRGRKLATLRMRQRGDLATLEGDGIVPFPPLLLTEHRPGLYFCSLGEALDLTATPATYANVPLRLEDGQGVPAGPTGS